MSWQFAGGGWGAPLKGLISWLILSRFIFSSTSEQSVIDDGGDFTSHFAF